MSYNTLYKRFLCNLVSEELRETYMILNESIIPNIKTYMKLLLHTPFIEESYHRFYGNVKNIIESFFLYWTQVMHKNIETANGYLNPTESNRSLLRERVLLLMEKTVNARAMLQNDFEKDFIGINSQFDVKHLENEFEIHLLKFQQLLKQLENFDYQELQKFVNANIYLALTSEHKILEFASHQFATFIIDNHKKILISLEENFKRVSRKIQSPIQQLQSPKENAFAVSKIEPEEKNVKDELEHWQRKLHEFLHIKNNLDKLEKVNDKLLLQQQHASQISNENVILEKSQKLEEFKKLEIEVSKSFLTFFCVEGANRLNHSDAIGSFFMDEYGHRVYSLNYGLNKFHTCGDYFVKVHEDTRPYYDENGRYVMEDKQKLYKAAPCCSAYKLDDWGIFIKDSDSGYPNQCKEEIKKSYYDTIKAIEKEFAKLKVKVNKKATILYLWNSLGDILTKSLLDIAKRQPENPLHCLAHTLLHYKYHKKSADIAEFAERSFPNTEAVFKIKSKTSQIEHKKSKAEDEYEEMSGFYSNIAQQFLFNLFEH